MPSPVSADALRTCRSSRRTTPGAGSSCGSVRSALLSTTTRGLWPAPSSSRTVCTVRRCSAAWRSARSTTSIRASARVTSSRVAWKASTSWCGSLWMKPTVSLTMTVWPSRKPHPAGGRVEGGEEHVLGHRGLLAHQGVEQRRLAGVGVAHDGHGRQQAPLAGPSGRLPAAPHLLHALPGLLDALADDPAVGLQLGLPRASRADAATRAREVGPQAGQPRQLVLQLRQLHLDAALVRLGPLGEDVEDHAAAVEHLDVEQRLRACAAAWATARRRPRAW